MGHVDQREHQRFRVAMLAYIWAQDGGEAFRCLIRDVSLTGCKVVSRHLPYLPDLVSLQIPNIKEVMDGRVVWREDKIAGIEFMWGSQVGERSGRLRRSLNITVSIFDKDDCFLLKALVTDATRDGCRVEADDAGKLPDEVRLKVPGLMEPVSANVSWRQRQAAGIEFHWKRSYYLIEL